MTNLCKYSGLRAIVMLAVLFGLSVSNLRAAMIPLIDSGPGFQEFKLSDALAPNAYIESLDGQFKFSNFTFDNSIQGPLASQITVLMSEVQNMIMFQFQLDAISGKNTVGPGDGYDLQVGYVGTAVAPNASFTKHTLSINSVGVGEGFVFMNEELRDQNLVDIISEPHFVSDNNTVFADRSSHTVVFNSPQKEVHADKDLVVFGGVNEGGAFFSHFKQTFMVDRDEVPEPASIGLGLLSIIGFCAVRRFRR